MKFIVQGSTGVQDEKQRSEISFDMGSLSLLSLELEKPVFFSVILL